MDESKKLRTTATEAATERGNKRGQATQARHPGRSSPPLQEYRAALGLATEDAVGGCRTTSSGDVDLLQSLIAYFQQLLDKDSQSAQDLRGGEGIDVPSFRTLALYARTGCLELSRENVTSVLNAALKLGADTVLRRGARFLLDHCSGHSTLALEAMTRAHSIARRRVQEIMGKTPDVTESQFLQLPPPVFQQFLSENRLVVVKSGLPLTTEARELYLLRLLPRYFEKFPEARDEWALLALTALRWQSLPRDELIGCVDSLLGREKACALRSVLDSNVGTEGPLEPRARVWSRPQQVTTSPFGPGSDTDILVYKRFRIVPRAPHQRIGMIQLWTRTRGGREMLSGLKVIYHGGDGQGVPFCSAAGDVSTSPQYTYRCPHENHVIGNVFVSEGEWISKMEFDHNRIRNLSLSERTRQGGYLFGANHRAFFHLVGFQGEVVWFEDHTFAIRNLRFSFEEFLPRLPEEEESPLIVRIEDPPCERGRGLFPEPKRRRRKCHSVWSSMRFFFNVE